MAQHVMNNYFHAHLIFSLVQFHHRSIDLGLLSGIHAQNGRLNLVVDIRNSFQNPFTHVNVLVTISKLNGLVTASQITSISDVVMGISMSQNKPKA